MQKHGASADDPTPNDDDRPGRKRWLLLLLLLLILLLLVCGGFAYFKWWKKDTPTPTPSASPTAVVTTEAPKPTPSATTAAPSPSPSVATATMPDLIGKNADDAAKLLQSLGFTNVTFVAEGSTEPLKLLVSYTVTKQSVPAGQTVPVTTAITITAKASSGGNG